MSENLANKETHRIHMASRNQAAGRDGGSLRESDVPPGQAKNKNISRTCSLHHINGADPAIQTGL